MKKILLLSMALTPLLPLSLPCALLYAPAAHAQSLNAELVSVLREVPFGNFQNVAKELVDELLAGAQTLSPDGKSTRKLGNFQLHAFVNGDAQAVVLSYDGVLPLPEAFINQTLEEFLGNTEIKDPMLVFSLVNGVLATKGMPADLKRTIALSYYDAPALNLRAGVQLISRVIIGGQLGDSIAALGVPAKGFIMTLGQNVGLAAIPSQITGKTATNSDATSAGDKARLMAQIQLFVRGMKNSRDAKAAAKAAGTAVPKTPPDYFVEFQTAPGTSINPLGMAPITLSDATIFVSSLGTMGYKGNAIFSGLPNKKFLTFFEAPYDAAGALKMTDFKFGLAAPTLNLGEFALISTSFVTPKAPGGGFLKSMDKLKAPLASMAKPLSLFRINNPNPVPEYRFGDPAYPFPSIEAFNIMLLGPFASETLGGRLVKGPYLKVVGSTTVLGKDVGAMDVNFSEHGLFGAVNADFGSLDLGPIKTNAGVSGRASISIDDKSQVAQLSGKLDVPVIKRDVNFTFGRETISMSSPATCVVPMDISGRLPISGNVTFADVAGSFRGFGVDAAKLPSCAGEFLKQGLKFMEDTAKAAAALAVQIVTDPEAAARAAAAAAEKAALETARLASGAAIAVGNAVGGVATAAEGEVGKRAGDAYNLAARGVDKLGRALTGMFRPASAANTTCDNRNTWLRERGNTPTPRLTQYLLDSTYTPLATAGLHSRNLYIDFVNRERLREPAHSGLQAMGDAWNGWAKAKNMSTAGFAEYHAANVLLSGNAPVAPPPSPLALAQARPQGLATASPPGFTILRDTGTATIQSYGIDKDINMVDQIAGWKAVAEKGEYAGISNGDRQWYRCANAYIADLPVTTARNLKTYLPPVNGTTQPYVSAMFNSSAEYNQLLSGIRTYANTVAAQNANWSNLSKDFYALWMLRSAAFVRDLSNKMAVDPLAAYRKDYVPDQQPAFDAIMARANRVRSKADKIWYMPSVQNAQTGRDIWYAKSRIDALAGANGIGGRLYTRGLTYKRADDAMNRYTAAVQAFRTGAANMASLTSVNPATAAKLVNDVTAAYDAVPKAYQDALKQVGGGQPLKLIAQADFDQIERQVEILEDIVLNFTGEKP